MDTYFLLFSGHFDRDPGIDQYRLRLCSLDEGSLNIWVATTGTASKQGRESFHYKGGMIPPEYRCKGLPYWRVSTKPLDLSHVKGVEGEFFQIFPYNVVTDNNGKRSDFGIHRDANVPGSLGCPVLSDNRFETFKLEMRQIFKKGVLVIPLFVTYS